MTKKTSAVDSRTAGKFTVTFDDGTTLEFDPAKCSEETRDNLMFHGASQKIGDSYAGAGESADPLAYAKQAAGDTIQQLYDGEWRVTAAGGPRVSDLAAALSRISGEPVEKIVEGLSKASDEAKKDLRKDKRVAAVLAAIKAENAAKRAAKLAEEASKVEGAEALPSFA